MTRLHELHRLGQAAWFDYISRPLLISGELNRWVEAGVRGVTSNPAIFEQAIARSSDYDKDIGRHAAAGKTVAEIYEALALADIQQAADVLRQVYEGSGGEDGYVSLEVSPELAHDPEATISEAKRLFAALDRPNVMIKVPATAAGIAAIENAVSAGINVNATLIFSLAQYEAVAQAYIAGLEKRAAAGRDISQLASVASFFVSRVDTAVDARLAALGNVELQGMIAIDNARLAYARFREIFGSSRWQALAAAGARLQRPLWASTGTKNPAYRDTLYVDTLIGAHTVNTMPPATLTAFLDHGAAAGTISVDLDGARQRLARLAGLGIDLDAITAQLLADGLVAFARPFAALLTSIGKKVGR